MARVAWVFNGYSWPINPEKDSGWVKEEVYAEQVPIRSPKSSMQWGGRKTGRRQISGWLYGPSAQTLYNNMVSWKENRTRATLTDHFGNASVARLVKFDAEYIQANGEWLASRPVWRYNAEFLQD